MTNTHASPQPGYYLNTTSFAIAPLASEGERLPAGPGAWRKIPTAAALLLTPIAGLLFVVALPLIGFFVSLKAAASKVLSLFHGSAEGLAATMDAPWQPGEAHLTGKREERKDHEAQGPPSGEDELKALETEIEKKRTSK